MRPILFSFLLTACFIKASSQVNTEAFLAGFKTLTLVDSSRLYKADTPIADRLHFRPLDLDVWYPSLEKKNYSMVFGDLLKLFELRANKYQDKDDYTGITAELALQFALESGLKPENARDLLVIKTNSYRNSIPTREKMPLILYMAGLNGMSFENYKLLEHLAESGYVVLSISSVGRYPGNMTDKKADMMEQVYDAEYAINALKNQNEIQIDFEKMAVIGYSWGGMSAGVLISRNAEIKALVSLDGSENHVFGESEDDDKNLKEIVGSALLNERIKDISYLYLKSGNSNSPRPVDQYSYYDKVQIKKYYLCFTNSGHEDLSCIPFLLNSSSHKLDIYNNVLQSTRLFLHKELKNIEGFDDYYNELKRSDKITTSLIKPEKTGTNAMPLKGTVFDSYTGKPLPYVNIGTLEAEIGTVTNESGQFEIRITDASVNDSLRISMIGYKSQVYKINELLALKDGVTIKLAKDINQLKEVLVTSKKLRKKVLGNKTTSKFLSTPFNNLLGTEMGIKIPVRTQPVFVDAFNFHISYNRLSTRVWFRLNIYDMKNGRPFQNILSQNILIPVAAKQTGLISVDLKPYDISLADDVIVTLEWIKNETEPKRGEALYLSASLLSNGTFVKRSSQARIVKRNSLGVAFNLNVRY
ncbi:carboxypeptidase-like regulatory domain-containing protein [Arcticibacter eurypsychrophilus]|uniref:carboxypeptidase-like regulatory domain-containing protein n=1 Tax=Arcticibacter eurypsychrophilus TaxID=1434752 RepID=UPI001112FACF|nr:carboxypeptidase-like regulatory domain-containing protein [Arcticibacter eurypsychrophilus]